MLGHPSQVTEHPNTTMTTHTQSAHTDLRRLLVVTAAVFAFAGGLIHLAVIRQHFDFPIVAGGFAFIGIAQWIFALTVLKHPIRLIVALGGILHTAIAGIWILSRTTGLPFLPGVEEPALVGVVDTVATTFSVGAIGAVIIWRVLNQSPTWNGCEGNWPRAAGVGDWRVRAGTPPTCLQYPIACLDGIECGGAEAPSRAVGSECLNGAVNVVARARGEPVQ